MRRHHTLVATLTALLLLTTAALAERDVLPLLDYRGESWFLPQSPSVTGGPAGGLFNPAAFAMSGRAASDFWWNDRSIRSGLDNYGFGVGSGLNFAMQTTTWGETGNSWKTYDYQLGLAGGSRRSTFGVAYRWSRGELSRQPRQQAVVAGLVSRPRSWLNTGVAAALSLESNAAQYIFDVGVRPLGRDWLTLFADWTVNDDQAFFRGGSWGAGVEVRPARGLHLGVRARERVGSGDVDLAAVVGVTLNDRNLTGMPLSDVDSELVMTSWLVRTSPPFSGIPLGKPLFRKGERLHAVNLENRVLTYQKYRWFDKERVAWLDLLRVLNAALADSAYDGVALNLAGFRGRPSLMWEFRVKLEEFQAAGKRVVIHGDRFGPTEYMVASVADHLTLDPLGSIVLPGMSLSRSYLKGTLEKLGLGFQEFRYFTYKSAVETYSRDHMSEADREQRQRIVDVIYETHADAATSGRHLPPGAFDTAVDEQGMLSAREALAAGLVDGLGRWADLGPQLADELGARLDSRPPAGLRQDTWDDRWGRLKRIPVVYAVGPCAMDSGIKGRATSAYLRGLVSDPDVVAVVLRADSPGGDPLPSDLVADAVRRLKEAGKPVIVSQGDVAASGGYWISMDGSRVLTTPLTITGSIGVIGGWVWDDGFAGKLGVTSDAVSRGAHADLLSRVNVPFIGSVPRRGLTPDELVRIEEFVRAMYEEFVQAVATGRGLDVDAVRAVAEGRVWMGGDAVERGLCDAFGTLDEAIGLARTLGGVPDGQEISVTEYPARKLFPIPSFFRLPSLLPFGARLEGALSRKLAEDAPGLAPIPAAPLGLDVLDTSFLRAIADATGRPLLMISPEDLPAAWRRID